MVDFFDFFYENNIELAADFHRFVIAEHSRLAVEIQRLSRTLGEIECYAERALFSVVDDGDELRVQPVIALFASQAVALRVAERALDLFSLYLPNTTEEFISSSCVGPENLKTLWDRYQWSLEQRE